MATNVFLLDDIGMVVGMVLISKLMAYLLHHYHTATYFSMIGLMLGSVFTLMNNKLIFTPSLTVTEIIFSVILLFAGALLSYKISNRKSVIKEQGAGAGNGTAGVAPRYVG